NVDYDEAAASAYLGLTYHNIPIEGPADMTRQTVHRLQRLLDKQTGGSTLIHCASGNRVGALMALRAGWLQEKSSDDALATGRHWGLQPELEPALIDRLATVPTP